jgi:hypothetical protein
MKELTLQEVLQIAGGVPDRAALDELSYREGSAPAWHDEASPTGAPPSAVQST